MGEPAVRVEDLCVEYGRTKALDGMSVEAAAGSTLGVLGHNGAGKTTLIRVLSTLVRPCRGRVEVDGVDAVREPARVRRLIGTTGQYAGLDEYLTGRENLELIARLTGLGPRARRRAEEALERLDLTHIAERRVAELSGGLRRRVDLAASLVGRPRVLFLDEPTTGLDPAARVALWDVVGQLNREGTTVLLTTQYLEEADALADRIVVLDHGRVAAHGTPSELKALVGGKVVHATVAADHAPSLADRADAVAPVAGGHVRLTLSAPDPTAAAQLVAGLAADAGLIDVDIASPSLDDVFFNLATTGVDR